MTRVKPLLRLALLIGGLTCLIAIPLAILLGLAAGYFGGRVDDAVFFLISTLASMPGCRSSPGSGILAIAAGFRRM